MGNQRKRKGVAAINKKGTGDKNTTSRDDTNEDNANRKSINLKIQSKQRSKSLSSIVKKNRQMVYSSIILIGACIASLFWNDDLADPIDAHVQTLVQKGCSPSSTTSRSNGISYCSNSIIPTRRTFQTLKPISKSGETLFEIPRSMQLWDIDALRYLHTNPQFKNLLIARHKHTNNPLATGSFLATYLSLLMLDTDASDNVNSKKIKLREAYLNALPTVGELQQNHPIFWDEETLIERLNNGGSSRQTLFYVLIRTYRDMILSEYNALQHASVAAAQRDAAQGQRFDQLVNRTMYTASRINVMTRSFNPGSCYSHLLQEEKEDGMREKQQFQSLHGEIEYYRTQIGHNDYLLENNGGAASGGGCHAMVPFLDLLNHHPNPNVKYRYDKSKQSFVIQSLLPSRASPIPPNHELYDSYGKHTESHLFAKYGFVNGDGSSMTQVSLALYHRVLNVFNDGGEFSYLPFAKDNNASTTATSNKMQRKGLRQYLRYDDGYSECVKPSLDGKDYHLKKLKLQHLELIANQPSRWNIHIESPRNPHARPPPSSSRAVSTSYSSKSMLNPPEFDPNMIRVDLSKVLATCRLISLTVHDYNGQAVQLLEDNVDNPDFTFNVEEQYQANDSSNDDYYSMESLDYRSFTCLARLAGSSLMTYKTKINDQYMNVKRLNTRRWRSSSANPDEQYVTSTNDTIKWAVGHVQLGEMQTLQVIMNIAFSHIHKIDDKYKLKEMTAAGNRPSEYIVRDIGCPIGLSESLLPPLPPTR